jgi:hypothetical protein
LDESTRAAELAALTWEPGLVAGNWAAIQETADGKGKKKY